MKYILSVSEINKYIKEILSRDLILSNLWIRGEISNYKHHYSGHMYFTLKDDRSLVKCVMFRNQATMLKFTPDNGMKVIIRGYISLFERDGQYQLYAEEMQPDGVGNLHLAFEQLKKKLSEEGLFDADRKKKLPFLPGSIGVITSSTGSVIRDIIHVLDRRFSHLNVKIYPVAVQGEHASQQISRAIKKINELDCVDVIIIARGGGSLEELWAFNEEIVARSIFESRIPIISAIGHETDYTIADFVADVRAPTPSAAAEIVVPEKAILINTIAVLRNRLKNSLAARVRLQKEKYLRLCQSIVFQQPYNRIYQERMRLDIINKYILKAQESHREKTKNKIKALIGKLDALSPLNTLSRGYSVTMHEKTGKVIRSITNVEDGDIINVELYDGKLNCVVKSRQKENNWK